MVEGTYDFVKILEIAIPQRYCPADCLRIYLQVVYLWERNCQAFWWGWNESIQKTGGIILEQIFNHYEMFITLYSKFCV